MFGKNSCGKCGKKVNSKYDFCPFCGFSISGKNKEEDFGMLGKDDNISLDNFSSSLFGGLTGGVLNKMLGSAMKMLEKEIQKEIKQSNFQNQSRSNFQLFINGKKVPIENLNKQLIQEKPKENLKKFSSIHFSEKNSEKFSKLQKLEPKTNIKRISNKIFYELDVPGVKSLDDVSIIKLEGSIELKAIGKNNAYFKVIPIRLEIAGLELSNDKLILELVSKN